MHDLPSLLADLLKKWKLSLDQSPLPAPRFAFLAPVITEDGRKGILRFAPHKKSQARATEFLNAAKGQGMVELWEESQEMGAQLLERAIPGQQIKTLFLAGNDNLATENAAKVILRLRAATRAHQNLRLTPLETLALGFEKYLRQGDQRISNELVLSAEKIFMQLLKSSPSAVCLHGDLHHENIISGTRNPWLAIDPKGLWGDPSFEVGAWMRNPMPEILSLDSARQILVRRAEIFSKLLEISKERIWAWSYSQCILAAIWSSKEKNIECENWLKMSALMKEIEERG